MVQPQPVLFDPGRQLLCAHALIAQRRRGVEDQAVAGGGAQRVDDVDLDVGILLHDLLRGLDGEVIGARKRAGDGEEDDVLAFLGEGFEDGDHLVDVRAGRLVDGFLGNGTEIILGGDPFVVEVAECAVAFGRGDRAVDDPVDAEAFAVLLSQGAGIVCDDGE